MFGGNECVDILINSYWNQQSNNGNFIQIDEWVVLFFFFAKLFKRNLSPPNICWNSRH